MYFIYLFYLMGFGLLRETPLKDGPVTLKSPQLKDTKELPIKEITDLLELI